MSRNQKEEFDCLVRDIIDNKEFQKLNEELHHGITRYNHSMRVAKATYVATKTLKMDYKEATRAALLHDFFLDAQFTKDEKNKFKNHPQLAVENAKKYYDLTEKQENIIAAHMFPANKTLPKSTEAWTVSLMDKGVATYEMYRFKFSLVINIWAIFIFNFITLQK